MLNKILVYAVTLCSWAFVGAVPCSASSLAPALANAPGLNIIAGETSDMLVKATPNTSGVSHAVFSQFIIDRPLKIINTTTEQGPAAALIIIHADTLTLNAPIEIVGETADILLIGAHATQGASCNNCSFANAGRVTLFTGEATYTPQGEPLALTPFATATLSVNGLSTANVSQMELIAQKMALNGQWNTQMRGNLMADGSYQFNPAGGLIMGAGGINVFYGFTVNYSDLKLTQHLNPAQQLVLPASLNIASQAVQVSSDAPLTVDSIITTQSDVNTPSIYRKKMAPILETIRLEVLKAQPATLILNGQLTSDNAVNVLSSGDVNINGAVKAAEVEYVAGSGVAATLTHRGNSQGTKTLKLNAYNTENNGTLRSPFVTVKGINSVQNRFGGFIQGDLIQLHSENGYIRNGSQYPFRQDSVNLVINPTNQQTLGNFATLDLQFNGLPLQGATRVNSLAAFILGKTITLKAKGRVENINPYFEYTLDSSAWLNGIPFSPQKTAQVQVVADNSLKIATDELLLNSSAVLGVNNKVDSNSQFLVNAPYIRNERYTTQTVIESFSSSSGATTTSGTQTGLYVFSPAGSIYSFAPLVFGITTTGGGFFNNTSYFEALSSAYITSKRTDQEAETAKVINMGLILSREGTTTTEISRTIAQCESDMRAKNPGISSEATSRACYYSSNITQYYGATSESSARGTLFFVAGDSYMPNFSGLNHNVKDELLANQTWKFIGESGSGVFSDGGYELYGSTNSSASVTLNGTYNWTSKMSLSEDKQSYLFYQVVTDSKILSATIQSGGGQYVIDPKTFVADSTKFKYDAGDVAVTTTTISVSEYFQKALENLKALLTQFSNFMKGLI